MKSRVARNKELHEKINRSVDDTVETEALSRFANRLNEIDDDFKPMHVQSRTTPKRAKETELEIFDTFENEYLKDFLDEVKAYNVEKGYRDNSNTDQNILKDINLVEVTEVDGGHDEALDNLYDDFEPVYKVESVAAKVESVAAVVPQEKPVSPRVQREGSPSFWENYLSILETEEPLEDIIEDIEEQADATFEDEIVEPLVLSREDITKEILKLTEDDIEMDATEIKLPEPVLEDETDLEDEVIFNHDFPFEQPSAFEHVTNDETHEIKGFEIEEDIEDEEFEFTETEVRKSRLVNALVMVALMGAVLATAIAVKFLLLS
ncbi:MAG: hypothetical protein GX753_02555 [Erysipelothrix sp.]|nr:hypothetical protein [Erysipelothrix sp.]